MLFIIATSGAIKGIAGLKVLLVLAAVFFFIGEIIYWVDRRKNNTENQDRYKK